MKKQGNRKLSLARETIAPLVLDAVTGGQSHLPTTSLVPTTSTIVTSTGQSSLPQTTFTTSKYPSLCI